MKIKSDNYTVGDLAKFYGVSTDTVRLYDRKGVLLSQKNDENNYRIYGRDDMIVMDFIIKLRMLDISLPDIKKITEDFTIEEIREYSVKKIDEIEKEIQRLSALKRKTEGFVKTIEDIENGLGKITVEESPTVILRDIKDGAAAANRRLESLGLDNISLLAVYGQHAIDPEHMKLAAQVETRDVAADYYMSKEDDKGVSQAADFPHEEFIVLPRKLCIHTIVKAVPYQEYDFHYKALEYAKAHNFKLTGYDLNRTLLSKSKGIHCADYYECMFFLDPQ